MSWVAVGVAGATLVTGAMSSKAAKKAASAQAESAALATDEQRRQYDQTRADQAPFMQTGVAANARLRQLLGLDASGGGDLTRRFTDDDLQADPVYQSGLKFGLEEGRGGINARAIAGGGYDSGATLKALTRFGTEFGNTKAGEAYNRFNTDQNNIYNRLAGVSGAGQVATGQVQTAGTNAANQISENLVGAGNARAAGIVGGASAWNNAVTGVGNVYNNYQSNETLKKLLAQRNSGTWYGGSAPSTGY